MIKSLDKTIVAAVLAAGLIALPMLAANAAAQSAQSAATADAKPATAAKPKAKTKKPPTAGQLAARERAKKCGAEWKEAKAAGKVEKGMTWPKYWSACNKRLKAASG